MFKRLFEGPPMNKFKQGPEVPAAGLSSQPSPITPQFPDATGSWRTDTQSIGNVVQDYWISEAAGHQWHLCHGQTGKSAVLHPAGGALKKALQKALQRTMQCCTATSHTLRHPHYLSPPPFEMLPPPMS